MHQELTAAGWSADLDILVLLSGHIDHAGAAARIQADTGCEVLAGGPDAAALAAGDTHRTGASMFGRPLTPVQARPVQAPEHALQLPGGRLTLVRVPGITEGSLAAWIDLGAPHGRLLFAEIQWPPGWNRGHSMDTYLEGLRTLLELEADALCDSHHGVRRRKDAVREFIQAHLTSASNSRSMGRSVEAWQRLHPGENHNP
jgi:glyoxylase-like metal-dependent hydrolase (beta-lactamase superfamily II)